MDMKHRVKKIEFIGYLSMFKFAGTHPQFKHMDQPPEGYAFVQEGKESLNNPIRAIAVRVNRYICLLNSFAKLLIVSMFNGAKFFYVFKFLKTRGGLKTQAKIPLTADLLFVPSFPLVISQTPWVIEIEDMVTLFYPFINGGETLNTNIFDDPYYPIVKALLASENCKSIICHTKSAAENLPRLFKEDKISRKTRYIPLGIYKPEEMDDILKEDKENVNILFTNSWHQSERGFYLRGCIDLLESFATLSKRFSNLRLTIKSKIPADLDEKYKKMIREDWNIKVIEQFSTNQEMQELYKAADIFVLPSDRLHAICIFDAMVHGACVVVSDGWGNAEYVENGRNGIVVKGRYGKVTWIDEQEGILKYNYESLYTSDRNFVENLTDSLSKLVEDKALRKSLIENAVIDMRGKYSLENWNNGLKRVFDEALQSENKHAIFGKLESWISKKNSRQFKRVNYAIFGACPLGQEYKEKIISLGERAVCFIDSFPPPNGVYMGLPVYKPDYLVTEGKDIIDVVVLASSSRRDQLKEVLKKLNYNKKVINKL